MEVCVCVGGAGNSEGTNPLFEGGGVVLEWEVLA